VESDERVICSTHGMVAGKVDRANAKLMAAAHELLELVKDLMGLVGPEPESTLALPLLNRASVVLKRLRVST
jgi:hypothetical protein